MLDTEAALAHDNGLADADGKATVSICQSRDAALKSARELRECAFTTFPAPTARELKRFWTGARNRHEM